MKDFRSQYPYEKRLEESTKIRSRYPDRIPVIVENDIKCDLASIDKKKFLVPGELTIGQFVYIVRKRIKLKPEQALFLFVGNTIPPTASLISVIYDNHKNEDGFLYITYAGENAFG